MDAGPGPEPDEDQGEPVDRGGAPESTKPDAAGSEEDDAANADATGRDPRRFNDWRKRSATGAVMTGIALGLREALELPDERPALVIEAPSRPDDPDHPIDLRFDPDDPAATVAIVRHRADGEPGGASDAP